jgi:hypothetical protein
MDYAGVKAEFDQVCVLRDGTRLYADVYRPPGSGPHPVLLMRQPYGKSLASTVTYAHPVWYARHGFIVVIQDVRGRGKSEGVFRPFVQEVDDGYDAVEWAASLPGSSGKVGMYGFSYQGSTQWAAAAARPPHLAAIAPGMCAADLYHGMFYPHGRFQIGSFLPWAFQLARDEARRAGDGETEMACTQTMRHPDALLWRMPVGEKHPILTRYFPEYYDWCAHPVYDRYWEERNWIGKVLEAPVPALHIGGWYDNYLAGTLQTYEALERAGRSPDCFHRLIIGPWVHIPWGRKAGGFDFGPDADGHLHLEHLRWFRHWLVERDEELEKEPPVRYFEYGSNTWRTAWRSAFGPPQAAEAADGAETKRWHLGSRGLPANGASGGGVLTAEPVQREAAVDAFVYDARLPMFCDSYLPVDRSALEDRFEMLNYTSDPLERTLHAAGSPNLTVRCKAAGGPTDLVAILTLVDEGGASRFLSIGRTEVPAASGESDEWAELAIVMRPFAAELPQGSRLRLELTGSAFPLFARHPNGMPAQRLPEAGPGDLNMATVAVLTDPEKPSALEITIDNLIREEEV